MPIFLQWRWEEKTNSFLVIFHFYDDYSAPNLRIKKLSGTQITAIMNTPIGRIVNPDRAWITWAPSHLELALLMELLCYANIINGLKKEDKRKLKIELQGRKPIYDEMKKEGYIPNEVVLDFVVDANDIRKKIGLDKKTIVYEEERLGVLHLCIELCPEYIDYLRRTLEPYLR